MSFFKLLVKRLGFNVFALIVMAVRRFQLSQHGLWAERVTVHDFVKSLQGFSIVADIVFVHAGNGQGFSRFKGFILGIGAKCPRTEHTLHGCTTGQ